MVLDAAICIEYAETMDVHSADICASFLYFEYVLNMMNADDAPIVSNVMMRLTAGDMIRYEHDAF